jgi:hypothetical protein
LKKKTQPRKRTRTPRTSNAVQLTDPHLTALLSFIDGARRDDPDGRFAEKYGHAAAAADVLLTSRPVSSAFELHIDRPTIYEAVSGTVKADIPNWTDPADSLRAFNAIQEAWHEESIGERSVDDRDITEMMPSYIEHAVYLGACLMYRLLNGGVR